MTFLNSTAATHLFADCLNHFIFVGKDIRSRKPKQKEFYRFWNGFDAERRQPSSSNVHPCTLLDGESVVIVYTCSCKAGSCLVKPYIVLSAASGPIIEIAAKVKNPQASVHSTGGFKKGIFRPAIIA